MEHKINDVIKLVPIAEDYAAAIFKAFDQEVITYLPLDAPPARIEDTIAFIKHSKEQMENETDLVWVILLKNEFAGCCGIHGIPSRQPHFGLWIGAKAQGQGVGKAVVRYVLDWGISNLDVEYIKYPVDKRNSKSIQLIHGLGLKASDNYVMGDQKKLDIIEYRLYKT
ncbi:GNAT family N-acetyltransferase [Ulvibacterium sp.]|uniref:GNAT family N-acetyltransferase n=1 Tax=Ulvibacterium sp. TaxID=2665914 RepID=UPI003BA90F2F